ncbi:ArsR/SmtB family transcription factor [Haloarchaeobius iranensis]|uniref:Transcriptional regulator, ArsR family n=1 Tax=Haloarchaeobius iranensis TaxID=996166 RepID=A0A1H0A6H2_9EURY|nr:metalloregulator ArsR/SmtB family transcription factor [Haloarchaeobius iranensis]SDN29007.1 transcriptional regulator, ArsR family [Haloarchaeobius iranensis]
MNEPTTDERPTDAQREQETGCCSGRHEHALSESAVATDVELLATLGNDTRYEALRIIAAADDDVCVCEIEPALGVSQGAVSQALSRLFSAGLVERRKEGRWRYYSSTPRAEGLLAALDETRGDVRD